MLDYLKQQNCLQTEFDEEIWYITIETVTVHLKKKVTFTFKIGTELGVDVCGVPRLLDSINKPVILISSCELF